MSVLVLTSSFPRFAGDYAGNFVLELCRQLKNDGFDLEVVAPSDKNAKAEEIMYGVKVCRFTYFFNPVFQRLAYGEGISDNLKVCRYAWIQVPLFFLFFALKGIKKVSGSQVIWSHWILPSGLVGALLKKICGKKHILTIYSNGLSVMPNNLLKRMLFRFIINNSDAVVTVSANLKEDILKAVKYVTGPVENKMRVVYPAVERENFRSKFTRQQLRERYGINTDNVILFMGRVVEVKGLPFLIKALSGLNNVTLIIAGDGNSAEELKDFAISQGVTALWLGFIGCREKVDYLTLCDLLVVPSLILSSGVGDSLPLVIPEAFACSRAVLASAVGGIPEAVIDGYNGYLFTPGDREEFVIKLKMMLGDRQLLNRMEKNAFKASDKFSLMNAGAQYSKMILEN